jgi:hypothetical protein
MSKVKARPNARRFHWDALKIGGWASYHTNKGESAERLRSIIHASVRHHRETWNKKFEVTTEKKGRVIVVWRVR